MRKQVVEIPCHGYEERASFDGDHDILNKEFKKLIVRFEGLTVGIFSVSKFLEFFDAWAKDLTRSEMCQWKVCSIVSYCSVSVDREAVFFLKRAFSNRSGIFRRLERPRT